MTKERKQRVFFKATKVVSKPVAISFSTTSGKVVEFKAQKDVPKTVRVEFYAKRKKK